MSAPVCRTVANRPAQLSQPRQAGLTACQARPLHRIRCAVRNATKFLKGGFGLTYRKSLQRSGNTSVSTLHFRARHPGRFKWLSRQPPLDRIGRLAENFWVYGNFGRHLYRKSNGQQMLSNPSFTGFSDEHQIKRKGFRK
jgi:hypothetical protein